MRIGFALEYSLGHTTHARNLKRVLEDGMVAGVDPYYVDLPYDDTPVGAWAKLPPVRSNWTVRASLGAYRGLKPQIRSLDGLLFHTQVTALFSAGLMRRVPSVVSLDATPLQIDALGAAYNHAPSGNDRLEAWKKQMNERAFGAAHRLVTWSEWAKSSLVADYGVPGEKVTVIPPGIDVDLWQFAPRGAKPDGAPIELLFVGGDWGRKGGDTLIAAYDALPPALKARTRLHLVTRTAPAGLSAGRPGVCVYADLTPNSEGLRALYARADLFVFPTRGDCLPLAVLEALASGLPVITTAIGALPEAVRDGETGAIVPIDDALALRAAIESLIADDAGRVAMGVRARETARQRFDAAQNYARLVDTVVQTVEERKGRR